MKAYIDVQSNRGTGFYSEVVTEQDYHDGGPFGCTIVSVDEVAS